MPSDPLADISENTAGATDPFRLAERLDPAAASPLAAALLARRGQPIVLDASTVRYLGAQCTQVLLSAAATWKHDDAAFRIEDPSDELREALRLLGLGMSDLLGEARRE